jgi:hypothetical protein
VSPDLAIEQIEPISSPPDAYPPRRSWAVTLRMGTEVETVTVEAQRGWRPSNGQTEEAAVVAALLSWPYDRADERSQLRQLADSGTMMLRPEPA